MVVTGVGWGSIPRQRANVYDPTANLMCAQEPVDAEGVRPYEANEGLRVFSDGSKERAIVSIMFTGTPDMGHDGAGMCQFPGPDHWTRNKRDLGISMYDSQAEWGWTSMRMMSMS